LLWNVSLLGVLWILCFDVGIVGFYTKS
jgi:hypothetical protein